MNKKAISFEYFESEDINDFSSQQQKLIEQTVSFARNAYAPYSEFFVSACLILDSGEIIKGANVENASYPVSICAERTLLSHTISNYPNSKIVSLAIYVDKAVGSPIPPCGMCRQTLIEAELRQEMPIEIILISKEGKYVLFNQAADLLPFFFDGSVL